MHIDIKSKIKVGILIFLTIFVFFLGIGFIESSIKELRSKRVEIENINSNVSILVLVSNRIYTLDDRITSHLISDKDFKSESNQIGYFTNGLTMFSKSEATKIDSLMRLKEENIKNYKEDVLLCKDMSHYYKKNMEINSYLRKELKVSITKYLQENNKKLSIVLDEYENKFYGYIIVGILIIASFISLGIFLVRDIVKMANLSNRLTTTIDDLLRYMSSKK